MSDLICPFEECRHLFTTRYNLNKHVNVHHLKIMNFPCKRCGRKFGYKHTLRDHLQAHIKQARQCAVPLKATIRRLSKMLNLPEVTLQPVEDTKVAEEHTLLPALAQQAQVAS